MKSIRKTDAYAKRTITSLHFYRGAIRLVVFRVAPDQSRCEVDAFVAGRTDEHGGDAIAIHHVGNLGLTWDHRAFDGSTAVLFLRHISAPLALSTDEDDERRDYLDHVRSSADAMMQVVESLFDLVRSRCECLGDSELLAGLERSLTSRNGAELQRSAWRQHHSCRSVARFLVEALHHPTSLRATA